MNTKSNSVTDIAGAREAVLSLRLTRAQHERLKEMAASQQRTVSQEIRFAVQASIDADDARKAAA